MARSRSHPVRDELDQSGLRSGQTLAAWIAELIGDWKLGRGPLLSRLSNALEAAIARGTIPAGMRLPSERELAQALDLSRSTVVAAYDRLKTDGRVHTLRGSGTYAGSAPSLERSVRFSAGRLVSIVDNQAGPRPSAIEFTIAALPGSREIGPAGERLAQHLGTLSTETPGYLPLGLPALRREIAHAYSRRGLPTQPEQIIVTSGAQQAISLVAQLFRGTRVALEDPTNPASIEAFRAANAEIVSISMDADGARIDELERLTTNAIPRAVYTASTYNNPTGTMLTAERRRRLVELSRRDGFTIVEDETLCDISHRAVEPPPPIASIDQDLSVISIGSACKLFWGGLRIGWVRATPDIVALLSPLKIVADLGTSLVGQALCAELMPLRERVREERRLQLELRYQTVTQALQRELPNWTWEEPLGGSSLWIELPYGDASGFVREAERHEIRLAAGPVFSANDRHSRRLRLPFVLEPEELLNGVRRLAVVWESYAPHIAMRSFDAVV
jgi:DNA-binding transcriptional MocR family regulator